MMLRRFEDILKSALSPGRRIVRLSRETREASGTCGLAHWNNSLRRESL